MQAETKQKDTKAVVEDAEKTEKDDTNNSKKRKHSSLKKQQDKANHQADKEESERVHGKPVSGRSWKVRENRRTSSIVSTIETRKPMEKKLAEKERLKKIQAIEAEVKSKRKEAAEVCTSVASIMC